MDHHDHMKHLREQSPSDGPFVALDWRDGGIASFFRCSCGGTLDIRSLGSSEFVYYIECPSCREVFAMPPTIRPIKLPAEHKAYVLEKIESSVVGEVLGQNGRARVGRVGWRNG